MTNESTVNKSGSGENAAQPPDVAVADRPANSRRKKLLKRAGLGLAIFLLVVAVPYAIHSLSHESTDDAFIDGKVVPVSPRVSGHVSRVVVADNQRVRTGDLLIELDPRDFEARLNGAEAALAAVQAADQARQLAVELTRITATAELDAARNKVDAAKAAVDEAKARLAMVRAGLEQAEAQAVSTKAGHENSAADLKRAREMADSRTISPQELDHAVTTEQIAAAELTAVQKAVDARRAGITESEAALKTAAADLAIAEARLVEAQSAPRRIEQSRFLADQTASEVERARAEKSQAQLNLSYTKIVAPCDGFVTKRRVEAGQFVQTGQSLMAIVPSEVWVTANFKETQLTRMKPGQPVKIKVDAFPDTEFTGQVDSIQRGTGARFSLLPPENATGNYVKVTQRVPVKIVFEHPEQYRQVLLAPGMSVVPEVDVGAAGRPIDAPAGKGTSAAMAADKPDHG